MLKFLDELNDTRVVWPGVEGATLTDDELDMMKYIINTSPFFSYYLYRGIDESFLILDTCLSYRVNAIRYVDVAQEIADKLPGVDVYFSGDILWRDSSILISVQKDLCSEVNDIQTFADSIMEQWVTTDCVQKKIRDNSSKPPSSTAPVPKTLLSCNPPNGTTVRDGVIASAYWNLSTDSFTYILNIADKKASYPNDSTCFGKYDLRGKNCELWIRGLTELLGIESGSQKLLDNSDLSGREIRYAMDRNFKCLAIGDAKEARWFVPPEQLKKLD